MPMLPVVSKTTCRMSASITQTAAGTSLNDGRGLYLVSDLGESWLFTEQLHRSLNLSDSDVKRISLSYQFFPQATRFSTTTVTAATRQLVSVSPYKLPSCFEACSDSPLS